MLTVSQVQVKHKHGENSQVFDSNSNQVAVFIDYQNLRNADWPRVIAEAEKLGRIVIKRAYADWTLHRSDHHVLLNLGVDVEQVSSKRGKNAADIRIAIDAMDVLLDKRTNITHVFLVSGDGDFTDLVNRLKFYGKMVIGVGSRGTTADYLREACDDYLFYEDLVAKKSAPEPRPAPPRRPIKNVNEARTLLRRVLAEKPEDWHSAGRVKQNMRQQLPNFDENNYGFSSFLAFAQAMGDVAETRQAGGGHTEIRLRQTGEMTLQDARQLLLETMRKNPAEWALAAQLKQSMRQLRAEFDEKAFGYRGFNDFLEGQLDLLATRRDEAANLQVKLLTTVLPPTAVVPLPILHAVEAGQMEEADPDEALIDAYVRFLRQQRVHLTPSEHRARIVLKVYELFNKQPEDRTLAQLQDVMLAYFAANYPQVPQNLVEEVLYQLFWSFCFEFDSDESRYPPETRLWDKRTMLAEDITSRAMMLQKCDRFLLSKIAERVQGAANVDRQVAMELLYGRVGTPQMLQHVEQLLAEIGG